MEEEQQEVDMISPNDVERMKKLHCGDSGDATTPMSTAYPPIRTDLHFNAAACGKATPLVCKTMHILHDDAQAQQIAKGAGAFFFVCKNASALTPVEAEAVEAMVNLSAFKNEPVENNVPIYDPKSAEQRKKFVVLLNKNMYMVPGADINELTPDVIASVEYQKKCQTDGTTVYEDPLPPQTFRITKPIVRFVYSLTLQFLVSVIPPDTLKSLEKFAGVTLDHGLLLERTKRNKENVDSTAKAKSLLLYHQAEGGLLVTNITIGLNTALPGIVASIVTNLSASGAKEVCETSMRVRKYFASTGSRSPTPRAMMPGGFTPSSPAATPSATPASTPASPVALPPRPCQPPTSRPPPSPAGRKSPTPGTRPKSPTPAPSQ